MLWIRCVTTHCFYLSKSLNRSAMDELTWNSDQICCEPWSDDSVSIKY
jgi:hypothetical protein